MIEKAKSASAQSRLDPAAIIKDTALTGIIAFAIFGPIIGLKTVSIGNSLTLQSRWGLVAALVAVTRAGRLLLNVFVWSRPQAQAGTSVSSKIGATLETLGKYVGITLLVVAILLPFIPGVDRRIVDLGILMLTY